MALVLGYNVITNGVPSKRAANMGAKQKVYHQELFKTVPDGSQTVIRETMDWEEGAIYIIRDQDGREVAFTWEELESIANFVDATMEGTAVASSSTVEEVKT